MTGVAGGSVSHQTIVITGLAGLAAGAFSMAAGEYTSVASQRELVQAELDVERRELRKHPQDEERELAALYESRGVDSALAREVAEVVLRATPNRPWRYMPAKSSASTPATCPPRPSPPCRVSAPSPWAPCSPCCPYLLGATVLRPALLLALIGLFACGAIVARVTARSWWYSGIRQLALGGAAAGDVPPGQPVRYRRATTSRTYARHAGSRYSLVSIA